MDDVTIFMKLYKIVIQRIQQKNGKNYIKRKRGKNYKVKIKRSLKEKKNCDENVDIMKNVLLKRVD